MNSGYGYRTSFGPSVTPQIIKNLMIANVAVFVAQLVIPPLTGLGVDIPERVWGHFEFWRPFTYMWLHNIGGMPLHLLMNMFMLWMFGSEIAEHWGEKRFLRYYVTCGVGAGLLIATVPYLPGLAGWTPLTEELSKSTLGASGSVIGVVLAFSFTWPERRIQLIFPPVSFRAIWLIPLLLLMEFSTGSEEVSHVGHLGGLLVAWSYLVNEGKTPGTPTFETMKIRFHRWWAGESPKGFTMGKSSRAARPPRRRSLKARYQRHRMRNKLRSVRDEPDEDLDRDDDDRTDR